MEKAETAGQRGVEESGTADVQVSDGPPAYGGSALPWPNSLPLAARPLQPNMSVVIQQLRSNLVYLLQRQAKIDSAPARTNIVTKAAHISRWRGSADDDRAMDDVLIADMYAPGQDKVFKGRVLTAMVVVAPIKMIALQTAIEDCQRGGALLSLYNLTPAQTRLMVPGRILRIRNPYLRETLDGSPVLRVDRPKETVKLLGLTPLCWYCLCIESPRAVLKRCSGCKQAGYCSVECQRRDWKENGHKLMCSKLVG
jgi:hypothetical protein